LNYLKFFKRINASNIYPRDFSFGPKVFRRKLYSEAQLRAVVKSSISVFASIFSDWQIKNNEYDVLFAEIDEVNFNVLAKKTIHIYKTLRKYNVEPIVFHTGGRSSHFYIPFKQMFFKDYRGAARFFWESFDFYPWLDSKVLGDTMRISRVPGSLHYSTGMQCLYLPERVLNKTDDFKDFIIKQKYVELSDIPDNTLAIEESKKIYDVIAKEREVKTRYHAYKSVPVMNGSDKYPLCIRSFLAELVNLSELDHYKRVQLVLFFKNVCKTNEQRVEVKRFLFNLFKSYANDFNEKMTRYQLDWIFNKDYNCYACEKSKVLGICPLGSGSKAVCEFYPSINHHLKFYDANKILKKLKEV